MADQNESQPISRVDEKAIVQRQLVSDISKEAVLREVASEHEKNTFASFNRVQEIERSIRKYYASYATGHVSGEEPFEKIIRVCGREPVVMDLLEKLSSARTAAALRARDLKDLNELVGQCGEQRAAQAAKHAQLGIQEAEEEAVEARVQEIIQAEKAQVAAQPEDKKTAADELRELAGISQRARANYLESAHNRRGGYLWPSSGRFNPQLRAAELAQLGAASRAIQAEGGVRSAVRFLTDHPFSLAPTPYGAACATTHAFAGNANDPEMPQHFLPHSLRDTCRAEAEALPEVGADIKSVFVTARDMPNAYAASLSQRAAAQSGYPYLHANEWPVAGLTPRSRPVGGATGRL